jgi:hypothetical protein
MSGVCLQIYSSKEKKYDILLLKKVYLWLVGQYIVYKCIHRCRCKRLCKHWYSWSYHLDEWRIFLHDTFKYISFQVYIFYILTWSNNLTAKQGDNCNVRSIKLKGAVTTMSSISKSKHFAAGTEKGIVSDLLCAVCTKHSRFFLAVIPRRCLVNRLGWIIIHFRARLESRVHPCIF